MVENKKLQHEHSLEKNGKNFTAKTGSDLDLEKISEGQSSDRCTQIFGENASFKVGFRFADFSLVSFINFILC